VVVLKEFKKCEFCGHHACSDCIKRKFPFPKNPDLRGKICNLCETKLYVRSEASKFFAKLEAKMRTDERVRAEIESHQKQLEENQRRQY